MNSQKQNKRRFSATQQSTVKDLQRVMEKVGATSLRIDQDVMGGAVKVVFDRAGKRYTRECSHWSNSIDNLRAIGLQIEYLYRALEVYGVEMNEVNFDQEFDVIFGGMIATPDDAVLMLGSGKSSWFEVLGVKADSSKADIRNAYRALSKIHHPDSGGNPDDFKRLLTAYETGIKGSK
jgi:hypothetical protein